MSPAELVARLEAAGAVVPAPFEHAVGGMQEWRWVGPAHLVAAAQAARDGGYFLESMTCIDRLAAHQSFELLYTFNRYAPASRVAVRALVRQTDAVPSLSGVFPIAAWNEREAWEFFGVTFSGHPNLTWLLLPEDTTFQPLLKSFTAPPPSIYDDSMNPAPPAPEPAAKHE